MRSLRVEISGGIASGKTTLAIVLKKAGYTTLFEDFRSNPFWRPFYAEPNRYAFETEVTFLLQHYHQIKLASVQGSPFACDFSLLLDQGYADVNLKGGQYDAFAAVYTEVWRTLPACTLIVHLRCGAQEELARIRRRARAEERAVETDYLAALNSAVAARVKEVSDKIKVLEIDSESRDFATDREVQACVVEEIRNAIG